MYKSFPTYLSYHGNLRKRKGRKLCNLANYSSEIQCYIWGYDCILIKKMSNLALFWESKSRHFCTINIAVYIMHKFNAIEKTIVLKLALNMTFSIPWFSNKHFLIFFYRMNSQIYFFFIFVFPFHKMVFRVNLLWHDLGEVNLNEKMEN